MAAVQLFVDRFWISPFAYSVCVALEEKGVSYETVEISLGDNEHKHPSFMSRFVTGRIPGFLHGDVAIAESSAIVEYIDEVFEGAPLLPLDRVERAHSRQLMSWLRSDLLGLREERPTATMFYEKARKPLSRKGSVGAQKLIDVASRLIEFGTPHMFSTWSIADADMAFALHRLILNGDPVPEHLRDYARTQWQRPSVLSFTQRERPAFEPY